MLFWSSTTSLVVWPLAERRRRRRRRRRRLKSAARAMAAISAQQQVVVVAVAFGAVATIVGSQVGVESAQVPHFSGGGG